jgi:hypothetical protein
VNARRERKVVTVLFADLVGFTARAESLAPEDIEAILRPYHERLRTELEQRGGTVEKFVGDAVMAVFGAPVAHEDDPERAVPAALAIRDGIVEDGRASRLQSAAPSTGIIVGGTTYRATQDVIDYIEHDAVDAKGKAEPVPVWKVLQALSSAVRSPKAAGALERADQPSPGAFARGHGRELGAVEEDVSGIGVEDSGSPCSWARPPCASWSPISRACARRCAATSSPVQPERSGSSA